MLIGKYMGKLGSWKLWWLVYGLLSGAPRQFDSLTSQHHVKLRCMNDFLIASPISGFSTGRILLPYTSFSLCLRYMSKVSLQQSLFVTGTLVVSCNWYCIQNHSPKPLKLRNIPDIPVFLSPAFSAMQGWRCKAVGYEKAALQIWTCWPCFIQYFKLDGEFLIFVVFRWLIRCKRSLTGGRKVSHDRKLKWN